MDFLIQLLKEKLKVMDKFNKISFWLFLLLPCTLFVDRRASSIFIILLFLINIKNIFSIQTTKTLIKNRILLFSVIYFIAHGISLLFTKDIDDGLNSLGIILSFLIIPFIGLAIFNTSNITLKINDVNLKKLFLPLIIIGVISMIICLFHALYTVNFENGAKEYWFFYRGLASPLWGIHPIYLAYYFNFILSILLFHSLKLKNIYQNSLKWFIILLTLVFLILLSARTPLVVTFGIIAFYIYSKVLIKKYILLLISTSCVIIIFIGLFKTNKRFQELFDENGIPSFPRIQTWKSALEVAQNNFFLGVPEGDLDDALLKVYNKNDHEDGVNRNYNCHNQYLQQLCYFGFIGLLFFILWLYYVFKASLKTNHILQILVISIMIYFCTETLLSVNKGIIFVSYFFTLIALYEK